MSTILFYLGVAVLLLVIASFIPGISELVQPVIRLVFLLITAVAQMGGSWGVVAVKGLIGAHIQFLRHLLQPAEKIDPTLE
ncbi:MAG: hypothetical protein ACYC3W_12105, partial [Candidatus Nanopelagicales bacterium]